MRNDYGDPNNYDNQSMRLSSDSKMPMGSIYGGEEGAANHNSLSALAFFKVQVL
jgi:hypothetical protein